METKCLSVVVPTYNEEDVIGECLDRLTRQLDHIVEIVVVDNNSTDATASVVAGFVDRHPEVRMISEGEQGLVFARNAGLNAAVGLLIARIDSDSMVPPGWARTIVEFFARDTDVHWAAACGKGEVYGLPYVDIVDRLKKYLGMRTPVIHRKSEVKEVPVLYGSNMILRRDSWLAVRDLVSMRRDIFEDVDTGLCIKRIGGRIAFIPSITVGVSSRRMETGIFSFVNYMSFLPRTLLLHRRYGYLALAGILYIPVIVAIHSARLVLIRGFDSESHEFALRNFRVSRVNRVIP
ncbi:glycosyltransferase involved in cell wall biosynthesis [Rhodococcus sp. 27YEA15]|uniref:glycosyltransferase family 2 protein n=1 Tax=Rhodococcus sp. 27YEA15 TaxID=3156259 RepID=UPI003C7AEAA4